MKILIDRDETLKRLCEICKYPYKHECEFNRCKGYQFILEQPIVVCVSDDFPTYKERCEHNEQKRPNQNSI